MTSLLRDTVLRTLTRTPEISHRRASWQDANSIGSGRADPESVSLLKTQLTVMHLWLHAKLVTHADPGRARPPAVQARALSRAVANDAEAELDSFRIHHETVALEKLEESLLGRRTGSPRRVRG
jgi:hypothetical protein